MSSVLRIEPVLKIQLLGALMPYRLLCEDVQREGIKPCSDLVSGLF